MTTGRILLMAGLAGLAATLVLSIITKLLLARNRKQVKAAMDAEYGIRIK